MRLPERFYNHCRECGNRIPWSEKAYLGNRYTPVSCEPCAEAATLALFDGDREKRDAVYENMRAKLDAVGMTHPHDLVEAIQGRLDRLHGYFRDYDWADAEDLKGLQDTFTDSPENELLDELRGLWLSRLMFNPFVGWPPETHTFEEYVAATAPELLA